MASSTWPSSTRPRPRCRVLLGNGDGTFQAARQTVTVGFSPTAVAAADFNEDGRLDLAVANNSTDQVVIPAGQRRRHVSNPADPVGDQPLSEAAGDFNGDGYVDLATADTSSDDVSILLGNGDGTFQAADQIPLGFFADGHRGRRFQRRRPARPRRRRLQPDQRRSALAVLLGNGDGTFQPPTYYPVGNDPVPWWRRISAATASYDLAIANIGSNNVSILLGNGDGTFQTAKQYQVGRCPRLPGGRHFNGDGTLDLAVADEGDLDPYTGQYIDGGVRS